MNPPAWSVYVEYGARVPDDAYDTAIDHLDGYHATVSPAPNGNFSMRVFVEEPTVERAVPAALAVCDRAVQAVYGRAAVVGIEVVTEEELDRRNREPLPIPDLVGIADLKEMLGVASRQRAAQLTQTALFQEHAQPVAHLKAGPIYFAYQVRAFKDAWEKQGRKIGRPRKEAPRA
jgi:hypothetical protein